MRGRAIIRKAAESEAAELTDLAIRSKAHWGYSAEFMEACRAELSVSPEEISNSDTRYRVCELGERIVGFYALERISALQYELAALFVDPKYIGQGFGRLLMDHACALLQGLGADALLIQGDPNAERFYLAAGAERVGVRESESIPGRLLPEFRLTLRSESFT